MNDQPMSEDYLGLEDQKMKLNHFYKYTGPNLQELLKGDTVRYIGPMTIGRAWVSNMNQPLSGCFSGFIPVKNLKMLG